MRVEDLKIGVCEDSLNNPPPSPMWPIYTSWVRLKQFRSERERWGGGMLEEEKK